MCWGTWEGRCWNSNPYPSTMRHTPAMDREELWETNAQRGKEGGRVTQTRSGCKWRRTRHKGIEGVRAVEFWASWTGRISQSSEVCSRWAQVLRMAARMLVACALASLLCQVRKNWTLNWFSLTFDSPEDLGLSEADTNLPTFRLL